MIKSTSNLSLSGSLNSLVVKLHEATATKTARSKTLKFFFIIFISLFLSPTKLYKISCQLARLDTNFLLKQILKDIRFQFTKSEIIIMYFSFCFKTII